ncbi:unnamed protein product [Linum trigynum]
MSIVVAPPTKVTAAGLLSELFPMVNVTITNNASHEVWYMCNNKGGPHDRLYKLGVGGVSQWAIRDIGFPLVWCYMHINDGIQGVFWGFLPKYRCDRHCDWWVKDDGLYLYTRYDDGQYIWLYQDGEYF